MVYLLVLAVELLICAVIAKFLCCAADRDLWESSSCFSRVYLEEKKDEVRKLKKSDTWRW